MPTQPPPFIKPPPRALSPGTLLALEIEGRDPAAHAVELARTAENIPNLAYAAAPSAEIGVPPGAGGLPPITLPDDAAPHTRTRVGPLGQVLRPAGSSAPSKKKKDPSQSQPTRPSQPPPAGGATPGPGGPGILTLASPALMAASAPTAGGGGVVDGSPKKSNASPKKRTDTPMQQFMTSVGA